MVKNFRKLSNKLTCYGLIVILVCMFLAAGTVSAAEWSLKEAAKPYAGQTVNLVWFAVPWSSELAGVIPQFEKETGIKVNITDYPYESLHEKIITELAGGTGAFDLILIDSVWLREVLPWLTNLDKLQSVHPELVDPQFNWEDMAERVMERLKLPGFTVAFPGYVTNQMLMYRKDLFDNPKYKEEFKKKYGYDLKVPNINTSFEEFKDICEFFTRDTNGDGKIDLYGYCSASAKTAMDLFNEYMGWLKAEGGRFFEDWRNEKFRPMIDTPEALAALKYHKDLLRYQPPGATAFGVFEQTLAFQKGEVAMIHDWTETIPDIENKEKSVVAGKVGYAAGMPRVGGAFGPMPVILPNTSKHKEAAFLLGQWIHSRDIMVKTKIASPPRVSMLSDPELQAKYPYYKATKYIVEKGIGYPIFPELFEWVDKLQSTLSRCLIGEISPEEALKIAQRETEDLMKEAGYTW